MTEDNDTHDIDEPAVETAQTAPAAVADVADIQRQRDEYKDLLLRKSAEFDNYRKRIDRERLAVAEAAAADLIEEILPLVDDLDRALNAEAGSDASEAYRRGVELIHRQLQEILRKRGVRADRGARRGLRPPLSPGGLARAGRRSARGRNHRGVPARIHAG